MKPSGPGLLFVGRFLITVSISLLVIGLFIFSNSSWFSLGNLYPDEWIKKMWYIYIMEYYSTIKRNEIGSFVEMWMDLESVIQSEVKSESEKQISYICGI